METKRAKKNPAGLLVSNVHAKFGTGCISLYFSAGSMGNVRMRTGLVRFDLRGGVILVPYSGRTGIVRQSGTRLPAKAIGGAQGIERTPRLAGFLVSRGSG